jgi:hypothetical protein
MTILQGLQRGAIALLLGIILLTTGACTAAPNTSQNPALPSTSSYSQLERGDTVAGEQYGQWVVKTAQGLIDDAYVRDNDKLGVVISPQVDPREVKSLARSLMQGFHQNFPNRDLSVLMYAPDKELILSANYDDTTRNIEYR